MKYEMIHTCIRVMDLEKSIEFYNKALGFTEVKRKDFKDAEFTLVYLSDGVSSYELELTFNYHREEPYTIGNGYGHIALLTDDLEKSYENHKNMGLKVSNLSGLPGEPPRFYFITDPDGYLTEIIRK